MFFLFIKQVSLFRLLLKVISIYSKIPSQNYERCKMDYRVLIVKAHLKVINAYTMEH